MALLFFLKTVRPREGLHCLAGRAGCHRSYRLSLADCRVRLFLRLRVTRIFELSKVACRDSGESRFWHRKRQMVLQNGFTLGRCLAARGDPPRGLCAELSVPAGVARLARLAFDVRRRGAEVALLVVFVVPSLSGEKIAMRARASAVPVFAGRSLVVGRCFFLVHPTDNRAVIEAQVYGGPCRSCCEEPANTCRL